MDEEENRHTGTCLGTVMTNLVEKYSIFNVFDAVMCLLVFLMKYVGLSAL